VSLKRQKLLIPRERSISAMVLVRSYRGNDPSPRLCIEHLTLSLPGDKNLDNRQPKGTGLIYHQILYTKI